MDIMMDGNLIEAVAAVAHPRNFRSDTEDEEIRLVVQEDYRNNPFKRDDRRRFNCKGQVSFKDALIIMLGPS